MKHTQTYFERGVGLMKNAGSWVSDHRYLVGGLLGGVDMAWLPFHGGLVVCPEDEQRCFDDVLTQIVEIVQNILSRD